MIGEQIRNAQTEITLVVLSPPSLLVRISRNSYTQSTIHTIKPPPSHPIPLFHRRLAGVGTTQATGLPSPTRPPSPFVFHALPHDPSSL
uniref:Uncharacterized protein n=1 Tax=Helianthus annuus TaxID=4232 RepID=A0A251S7Y3_HELAN